MNIYSINAKSSSNVGTPPMQYSSMQSIGQKGQIVEGLITKVSNKISIDFSGKEVTVSMSAVHGAKEGEIRKFEIKDISDNSIVLKEVGSSKSHGELIKATSTNVETDQTTFKEHLEKSLGEKEDEAVAKQEAKEAKERLEDLALRMTAKDFDSLMKEGNILEAYDVIRLDMALERVKDGRQQKQENIQKQVQERSKHQEEMIHASNRNKIEEINSKDIAMRLEDANLPVTEANITMISTAVNLIGSIEHISDKDMSYLIHNNLEPTIKNIYKAIYSSAPKGEISYTEEALQEMKGQIESIVELAGSEPSEDNLKKATWILEHNLPLTPENFANLNHIHEINIAMKDTNFNNGILDKIINSMKQGISPDDTSLYDSTKEVEKALSIINSAKDETIQKAMELGEVISINSLKMANNLLVSEGAKDSGKASLKVDKEAYQLDNDIKDITDGDEIRFITARRQLEEIRLKMTVLAGQKLIDKGIHIDIDSLSKLVEGLREQENSYYRNLLKETDVVDTVENIQLLQETTQKLNDLKSMPNYILGSTLSHRNIETIQSLHEVGYNLKSQLDKANEHYEYLMTKPRRDLGDSIQKAFSSVDDILIDNNLELTKANQRAVKILGYNNMEITSESIHEVKYYDEQVNHLLKELHPAVVVNMIKEGINPLDTSIQELNTQINEMKKKLGVTEEEKYSSYLWKLEREKGITEDQRKAYIGIYRLLNNVEKTDGAALGAVVKANQDVTLGHLLTAVRTMKAEGMNVSVDDTFGALESLTFSKESITKQLDSVFQKGLQETNGTQNMKAPIELGTIDSKNNLNESMDYMTSLLRNIMDEITPSKLTSMNEKGSKHFPEELLHQSIEKLTEELLAANNDEVITKEYLEEQVNNIRELAKNSEDSIKFLQSYDIPVSMNHLMATNGLLNQDYYVFSEVKRIYEKQSDTETTTAIPATNQREGTVLDSMNGLTEALVDDNSMIEQYNQIDYEINQILNKELGNHKITAKDIADLKNISNGFDLAKTLSRSRTYEIPVLVGDSITNINLKIVTGTKETGRIDMTVFSENLGTIEAKFSIKGEEVKGLILCDNRESIDTMKKNHENLENHIADTGLLIKQVDYGSYGKSQESYNKSQESYVNKKGPLENDSKNTDTRQLYQVAKALVYHVKEIELMQS